MSSGVEVRNLRLTYGDVTAIDDLSFTLASGKIYGLIGRNGSGKTSLLSVLSVFRRASAGTVLIDGEDPFENARIMRQTCFIRDEPDVAPYTVRVALSFAAQFRPYWDGIGGLLAYPMMFTAGLWTPGFTPEIIRHIGEFTPLGAGVQALQRTWAGGWPQPQHLIVMAGCVMIFGALAAKTFRWE